MPELPEVETIVTGLRELIVGHTIREVIVREKNIIAYPSADKFKDDLTDKKILAVDRRGKYILLRVEDHKTLVVHLRMTGRLLVKPTTIKYNKHTHVIFKLNNDIDLRFHNVRKFGRMYLVDTTESYGPAGGLATLGPEPLSDEFTLDKFKDRIEKRKSNIKALLLNQKFLAGLGNIYVDEALFEAGVSPERRSDSLSESEKEEIYYAIRSVLKRGVEAGGTSFSDYLDARGGKGNFQKQLRVYQQEDKKCPVCGNIIIKKKIAGRGTHYCPTCQK
ncbi:MAG: bifunctional DNA-formamidopyrimidine glycosylase/DNA-(apurinic or apyrimidinic site) lyase [Halanaerobiales bacterium]